jgi:hypothetical protein
VRWFFDHSNLSLGYKTKISQIVGFGQELVEKGHFLCFFRCLYLNFVIVGQFICHGRPVYIPLFHFLKIFSLLLRQALLKVTISFCVFSILFAYSDS